MKADTNYPGLGQAALLVLAVFLLQAGLALPVTLVAILAHRPFVLHPAIIGVINLLAIGAALAWGKWWTRSSVSELFPLRPLAPRLLLPVLLTVFGLTILASEAGNALQHVLPMPGVVADMFRGVANGGEGLASSAFLLVLVAPLTEELLFRGLILRGLLRNYSARKALAASAVLFTLLHGNPWQVVTPMALGLVLGWWFIRTRSLTPCLAGHALLNALALICTSFPYHIRGYNEATTSADIGEFQPLWFDLAGVALLAVGLWTFHRFAPPAPPTPPPVITTRPAEPPVIPSPLPEPPVVQTEVIQLP
jgi:membrane protease YdiL (CAAX protease family)